MTDVLNQTPIVDFALDTNLENTTYLIKDAKALVTTNGDPYIRFTLQDKTGTIDAQKWNTEHSVLEEYPIGSILFVGTASIDKYKNKQYSIILNHIEPLHEDDPRNDIYLYLESAPFSAEQMQEEIEGFQGYIHEQNPLIGDLIIETFNVQKQYLNEDFYTYPASREAHHTMIGGLAYHTLTTLYSANALTAVYEFNHAVVFGAIMVQGLGAIGSLDNPFTPQPTIEGDLFKGTAIVDEWLIESAINLQIPRNDMDYMNFRHCILSLSGAVEPQTKEALLLKTLLQLDKQMNVLDKEVATLPKGDASPDLFVFNRRKFYNL